MDRLLMLYVVTGLIFFTWVCPVNGEELFRRDQSRFFSANPMFQADVIALEKKNRVNSLGEMNYELDIFSPMGSFAITEDAPEDSWNEIRLSGLTLSLSRHVQEKEHAHRRINLMSESPHSLDTMLPLLMRGARHTGDIEALGGFLNPRFNLKIIF